ncbi:MAG: magnesium and cobalt transport protein CorA [Flavipsychrobacter sp.]|nr:magnesium and cobalt transport protein CorA [Flavipsychrobacter sp.]
MIYEAGDKRRLYYLIDLYSQGKINEPVFSREFCQLFDHEIEYEVLTPLEETVFDHLSNVASRYSSFEKDHILYPGVFYTVAELKEAIVNAKEELRGQWLI